MVISTIQEPSRNDSIAVGTTNVTLSEARNDANPRKVVMLRNQSPNSTDTITVFFGNAISSANKGIILRQNEVVTDSADSGYSCWQGTINAICATATGSIAIFER